MVKPAIGVNGKVAGTERRIRRGPVCHSYRFFDPSGLTVLPIYHFTNFCLFLRANWPCRFSILIDFRSCILYHFTILIGVTGFTVFHGCVFTFCTISTCSLYCRAYNPPDRNIPIGSRSHIGLRYHVMGWPSGFVYRRARSAMGGVFRIRRPSRLTQWPN